jgi:competence protein ComEA
VKRFIKSYFSYSRRQLRGIYVLVSLILLVLVFPIVFNFFSKDKVWDHSKYKETIEEILKANQKPKIVQNQVQPALFSFNPNDISKEELFKLGFSEKQTAIFLKYRNAGGKFQSKEDLKKVYGISDDFYNKLEPYIRIPKIEKNSRFGKKEDTIHFAKKEKWKNYNKIAEPIADLSIELNSADSVDLIRIPGIGPSFAKRIINFRTVVGGFYNKEQLGEVFGITPEMIIKISPYINIDTLLIVKIDLNQADFKILNKHPYIDYAQTKNLMKYKELMGKFDAVDDILQNHLMDTVNYTKVKPYLTVQ